MSWDDVFETPEEETAVIRRYREHLRTWNGQSWTRLPVKLTLCGDASVELGAAFEVESTLSDGGALTTTTTVRFPESIARASSTHREAYTCLQTVRVAIERHGESLLGAGVVYIGDNLGKCQAISNWYARDELLSEILAELYQLCICAGIEFTAEWHPRTYAPLVHADELGKARAVDNSSWALCPGEVRNVLRFVGEVVGDRPPTIDGMADPFNTVCEAFISRELTPGCVGADFFAHLGMLGGKTPD